MAQSIALSCDLTQVKVVVRDRAGDSIAKGNTGISQVSDRAVVWKNAV